MIVSREQLHDEFIYFKKNYSDYFSNPQKCKYKYYISRNFPNFLFDVQIVSHKSINKAYILNHWRNFSNLLVQFFYYFGNILGSPLFYICNFGIIWCYKYHCPFKLLRYWKWISKFFLFSWMFNGCQIYCFYWQHILLFFH